MPSLVLHDKEFLPAHVTSDVARSAQPFLACGRLRDEIEYPKYDLFHLAKCQRPYQIYSPTNILAVNSLRLTPQGAWGILPDGSMVMDAHHAKHRAGKNRGHNGLSLNFTSHYSRMQQHFGEHIEIGCAGENIVVETAESLALNQLGHKVVIQTANGNSISLHQIRVAAPCEPFSRYCLNPDTTPPAAVMKATLQFLDEGMRGFYVVFQGETADIQVGDKLFVI